MMAEATRSGNDAATRTGREPLSELRTMFELRRELAEAEIKSDLAASKRLAIVAGIGLVAMLTGLPLLTSIVTTRVDEALQLEFPWVSLSVALALLGIGALVAWSAWRRFRHEFVGLRDSLHELQEDMVWLRERFEGGE